MQKCYRKLQAKLSYKDTNSCYIHVHEGHMDYTTASSLVFPYTCNMHYTKGFHLDWQP